MATSTEIRTSAIKPVPGFIMTSGDDGSRPSPSSSSASPNGPSSKTENSNAEKPSRQPPKLKKELHGWRHVIQNFTPSWFSVNMGTGIVSILLFTLSTTYSSPVLRYISLGVFGLNVFLFIAILSATILRYFLYPAVFILMIQHPVQSLFLGTAPMGFATIVNMFALACAESWGGWAPWFAWAMWWVDVVWSVGTCLGLVFTMMHVHTSQPLSTMTAVWLLPIVAPIVASASGSIVAEVLPHKQTALWTILTCYVLWGSAVPLALTVLVIYFQRLAMHKLPPREAIVSCFLPIGPLGQGGFAIFHLGKLALNIFPETKTLHTNAGEILYVMGFITALIMWGFALVWISFAILSISLAKFPFNIGWWGFTFPLGVFTTSTLLMAEELPSAFFQITGNILTGAITLLWLVVGSYTVKRALKGEMFHAPCLANIQAIDQEHGSRNV